MLFSTPQLQICTGEIWKLWILINRYHVYELSLNIVMFVFHKVPTHTSVFINEPKLSDFKQVLTKEGLMAEFSGGVLVCNNLVAIRKVTFMLTSAVTNNQLLLSFLTVMFACSGGVCHVCHVPVCTFCVCGSPQSSLVNPFSAVTVFRRQHLTSKDDPRTKIIKIFIVTVDP